MLRCQIRWRSVSQKSQHCAPGASPSYPANAGTRCINKTSVALGLAPPGPRGPRARLSALHLGYGGGQARAELASQAANFAWIWKYERFPAFHSEKGATGTRRESKANSKDSWQRWLPQGTGQGPTLADGDKWHVIGRIEKRVCAVSLSLPQ